MFLILLFCIYDPVYWHMLQQECESSNFPVDIEFSFIYLSFNYFFLLIIICYPNLGARINKKLFLAGQKHFDYRTVLLFSKINYTMYFFSWLSDGIIIFRTVLTNMWLNNKMSKRTKKKRSEFLIAKLHGLKQVKL